MEILNLSVELPFKIGDKVWVDTSNEFGNCDFMDRYKKIKEVKITNIKIEFNLASNKTKIFYITSNGNYYLYDGFVAFTKEQYYEKFRKEIEELIPEDLRNYLWK